VEVDEKDLSMRERVRCARRRLALGWALRLAGERQRYLGITTETRPFPRPTEAERLAQTLRRARAAVSYYRARLPELRPGEAPSAWLAGLSLRTPKGALQADLRALMDERYAGRSGFDYKKDGLLAFRRLMRDDCLVRANTSGTTGRPLEFLRSKRALFTLFFALLEALRRLGWREGDAVLSAWQALRPRGFSAPETALRLLGLPLFTFTRIDEPDCRAFFQRLEAEAPAVLFGFPSYYLEFARYRQARRLRLRRPPRLLLCGGEALPDDVRTLLEQQFECPVYQSYGGNEFGFVACECPQRRGLHVLEHDVVVEADEGGELLVTTLGQPEMPLIKYETGDRALLSHEPCPCGARGTTIVSLEGRIEEYLLDGAGRRVFSRYFREVLLDLNRRHDRALLRAQFRQERGGPLSFSLEALDGLERPEVLAALEERLRADLGLPARGEWASRLLPHAGKFRFLVRT
jgi:phenylacetate-coenzyme A ligase PaaK-like adenylate-forming protein